MGPGSNMAASHDNAGIASWRFNLKAQISSYEDCERAMTELGDGMDFAKIGPRMTLIHEGHERDGEDQAKERSTCSKCLARTYRQEECVCEDGGDAEDFDEAMEEENRKHRSYAVELYDTKIIRYYPDDTFSVNNGGYATPTTRERLQAVLPDGFLAYHHSSRYIKRALGLRKHGVTPYPTGARVQVDSVLWPLDHSVRIDAATGARVSA